MRRWTPLLLLFIAGCAASPLARILDTVHPSKIGRPSGDPLGPPDSVAPPPPPGGSLQPPPGPPPPVSSGFMPSLSPRDASPLPPPEPLGPTLRVDPLRLPNT